jgi:tetratricopeptide (TPR) repeat protein
MRQLEIILALLGLVVLGGCTNRSAVLQRTSITSARVEAGYREAGVAAGNVTLGKYTEALARANSAVALAPKNPWAQYNRAAALHHLGRSDDAVAAYKEAEARFGEDERWGKSLAIYGRARALDDVGRCDEAKRAYDEFASFVRKDDPGGADMALAYAEQCRARPPAPGPEAPAISDMTDALVAGNHGRVVEIQKYLPTATKATPWVEYNFGAALTALGRTDDAIAAFSRAELAFGDRDRWGRSLAVWGRARALALAGRCPEAKTVWDEYTKVVGSSDPAAVRMADNFAARCK